MMRRALFFSSASLLVLTACTATNHGTPSPATSTSDLAASGTADQVPGQGVPKVDTPIDTTRFQQMPCNTLTASQINELLGSGVNPKSEPNAPGGPTCYWHSPQASQATVSVVYVNKNHSGLTAIYKQKGTTFPLFVPMEPIDGYPTVAYGQTDQRSSGECAIALGTSDRDVVDVSVALSEDNIGKKDPCTAAHDVAAKVLGNLRKGS